jgi:glycerophosphoryl diester phosphodiesterase
MAHPYFEVPTPTVIGHRGAAGEAPENTLPSFERALAQGAHVLETDVHLTRDGTVVLIHDDEVDRTTDGRGRVAELDLPALRRLDAGARFAAPGGGFPYRGRGLRIPTLEEAFRAFPGARFNLELKEDVPGLVEGTVGIVAAAGRAKATLLTAAEDAVMARLRAVLGRTGVPAAVGASTGDVLAFLRSAREGRPPPPEAMALQVPAQFGGAPVVTGEFVRHAHAHGIAVHVWTVNEVEEMHRLLDLGVDGLVTDFPARMVAVVAERER